MSEPIDISGISPETAMAAQPQPVDSSGVQKALSILDKADKLKSAGAFASPGLSLKASRQVGTVKNAITGKGGSFGKKIAPFGKPMVKEPGMSTKLAGSTPSMEALSRVRRMILSRAQRGAELDEKFDNVDASRASEHKLMDRLFVQNEGAETNAPSLVKGASVAPHVDAFFEKLASDSKLTTAQQLFPELQDIIRK
jgi:hypothetical protein